MTVRESSFGLSDSRMLLEQLRIAARSDGASPKSFALLLKRVFEERSWEQEGFGTFRSYAEAREPDGLGMDEERLYHAASLAGVLDLAQRLYRSDIPAATARGEIGAGRPRVYDIKSSPPLRPPSARPDRAEHIVARLKRDDPELAEKVVRGDITPNAAAREKGWRKPRILLTSPERVAESLRRYMPRDALTRLAQILLGDEQEPDIERPDSRD
jgi:hypothetical protein